MDALTQAALLGTTRAGYEPIATEGTVTALVAAIPDMNAEHRLLLQAGATAIYHTAGMVAAQGTSLPEPAPSETLPICAPAAAQILRMLLNGEHVDLLPEALDCLRHTDQILPPELLPMALSQHDKALRPTLLHVVGERGRWLSQFNKAWGWVTTPLDDGDALPTNYADIWQEGRLEHRTEILRRLRRHEAALARDWLAAVWQQERADARVELLLALNINLGADDIPWLASIAADRSERVRLLAAQLLAKIPASALAHRLRQRAATMIRYAPGALTGTPTFTANPPKSLDAATEETWRHDGLTATAPSRGGGGKRAWWLFQAVSHVPPTYWEEEWHLTPAEILTLAAKTDYERALIEGWSAATATFKNAQWALSLFQWWLQHPQADGFYAVYHYCANLQMLLTQPEQEGLASRFFTDPDAPSAAIWTILLREMPRPWSADFSHAYLDALRDFLATSTLATANEVSSAWVYSLEHAATGITPATFAVVDAPIGTSAAVDAKLPHLREALESFTAAIAIRRRFMQAITIEESTSHE